MFSISSNKLRMVSVNFLLDLNFGITATSDSISVGRTQEPLKFLDLNDHK